MATITTDTFLDSGTARTAGEAWTINGAILTIRTDTRWHVGAPASMTGTLGQINLSTALGGQMFIDATKVRWVSCYASSGTVPAIGTTIVQGGVSGYLLGIWTNDLQTAPLAVGTALPATFKMKLREMTGGNFTNADFTSGFGANVVGAQSADVAGWIEVVHSGATSNAWNTSPIDQGFKSRGTWFELGTTNGSIGQTFQVPTNGGGANTHVSGVQIETSPGSGVYEWWVGHGTATGFTTANFGTDARSKFFQSAGNGLIRIGSDGTNNIGYVPASGCKVRIPNIFLRYSGATAVSTNVAPSTSIQGGTTFNSGGTVDCEYLASDNGIMQSASNPSVLILKHSYTPILTITNNQFACTFDDILTGGYIALSSYSFYTSACDTPISITNSKLTNSTPSTTVGSAAVSINSSRNVSISNTEVLSCALRASSTACVIGIDLSRDITLTNVKAMNGSVYCTYTNNINIYTYDFTNCVIGTTLATNTIYALHFSNCTNTYVDGITFGYGGTFTSVNPYNHMVYYNICSGYNKIRNAGTRTAPLNCGASSTFYPNGIISTGSTSSGITAQRLYLGGVRSNIISQLPKQGSFEHLYGVNSMSVASPLTGKDCIVRNVGSTYNNTALTATPGQNLIDYFTADTTGFITWVFNQPDTFNSQYCTTSWNTAKLGTGWKGDGGLSMDTVGDYVILETPYWILGHTGFQNVTMGYSGFNAVSDYLFSYQLDKGSGYPGTWTTMSAANLSAETGISPTGFKMKIKVQWNNAANTNGTGYIYNIRIPTTSTLAAQSDNLYPLDTSTLSFTGLQPGSEVRCYTGSDPSTAVEIGGIESTSGSTFSFSHSSGGSVGYIRILAMGYQPLTYDPYTYSSSDTSILVQQVVDRNYYNPA